LEKRRLFMPATAPGLTLQIVHQYKPLMRFGDSFDYAPIRNASPHDRARVHHATCCDPRVSASAFEKLVDSVLLSLHRHVKDPDVARVESAGLETAGNGYVFDPSRARQTDQQVSVVELGLIRGIDYQPTSDGGGVMVVDVMPSVDVCPFSASIQDHVTLDLLRLANIAETQGLAPGFSGAIVNLYLSPENAPWLKGRMDIEYQAHHGKSGFGEVSERWAKGTAEVMSRIERYRDATLLGTAEDCGIDPWSQDYDPSPLANISHKYWVWTRANSQTMKLNLLRRDS
jgi:hypothetical protein